MAEPLLALSLHAIWPWAIIHLDKRVENRSPRFAAQIAKRVGEGWLAIHATKNVGNRPGLPATREALEAVVAMAVDAGWFAACHSPFVRGGELFDGPGALFLREGRAVDILASEVPTSAVVAVCRVGRVIPPGEAHPWKVLDSAAVELHDIRPLPEPIPCQGSQGLWRLPENVQAAVEAQEVIGGR